MAKKDKPVFNYALELKLMKERGPERLYFLCGPEDYLRECYAEELRKLCGVTEEDFSFRRVNGPAVDLNELSAAVDALPFFSERSFVEVRDFDAAKCRDADCERLKKLIADIPDYCTLVFSFSASNDPDGRSAAVKALKKAAHVVEFTEQEQSALTKWMQKRFAGFGKTISPADAQYLSFLCGTRMNGLIPEIEKIASYAAGAQITRSDIDAAANRIPEADVFAMTEMLSKRQYDGAAHLLGDLLSDKNNAPIMLTALIGQQFRRLYAVKTAQNAGRSRSDVTELVGVRSEYVVDKLMQIVKPYSERQLAGIVMLCAEYDCKMKSTSVDEQLLIRELFARIAAEE